MDCDTKKLFFANRGTNTLYSTQLYPDLNTKLEPKVLIIRDSTIISTDILEYVSWL